MKTWLVNPGEQEFLSNAGDRPPLGLMYLSSALKINRVSTEIKDLNKIVYTDFLSAFKEERPDFVGITCLSPVYNKVVDISKDLKEISSDVKIVVGGFHATHSPESFKNVADYIIKGYGEDELVSLITGKKLAKFDINRYAIPDRSIATPENYGLKINGEPATIMNTSRGCPYSCSFCGNFDKKTKYRDYVNIDKEAEIIRNQGFKEVYIVDDSFGLNLDHVISVCCSLDNNGLGYRVTTRANLVNDKLVDILKDTGCKTVSMGIESGNDEILKMNNKGITKNLVYDSVKKLGDADLNVKGFFILGLPHEDKSNIRDTIEFACSLKKVGLKEADFYVLCPFPGTPIYKNPEKFGCKIIEKDFTMYLQAGKEVPDCYVNNGKIDPQEVKYYIMVAKEMFREA
jgi:anaerobic magnesium-protoporphyrin IX monomethyl ester cyclase